MQNQLTLDQINVTAQFIRVSNKLRRQGEPLGATSHPITIFFHQLADVILVEAFTTPLAHVDGSQLRPNAVKQPAIDAALLPDSSSEEGMGQCRRQVTEQLMPLL